MSLLPHLRLGESYAKQGKLSAAFAEFQKAVGLAPSDRSAWLNVLQAQLALKRFREAQTSAERISQLDPASADLHNRLGAVQAEFGDYAGAIKNLEKANALQPDSYEFRYNLGLAYHRNGDRGSRLADSGAATAATRRRRDRKSTWARFTRKKVNTWKPCAPSKEARNSSRQMRVIVLILSTNFSSTRTSMQRSLLPSRPFAIFPNL